MSVLAFKKTMPICIPTAIRVKFRICPPKLSVEYPFKNTSSSLFVVDNDKEWQNGQKKFERLVNGEEYYCLQRSVDISPPSKLNFKQSMVRIFCILILHHGIKFLCFSLYSRKGRIFNLLVSYIYYTH